MSKIILGEPLGPTRGGNPLGIVRTIPKDEPVSEVWYWYNRFGFAYRLFDSIFAWLPSIGPNFSEEINNVKYRHSGPP